MVNKKKRPKKIQVIGDHGTDVPSDLNGQMTSSMQSNIQSSGSFEVKQEADIKQEPLSVGELVDVPSSTYENATHRPDSNGRDADDDLDFQSLDEVKEEVKKECDDQKEEQEPKMNADSGDEAMGNQPVPNTGTDQPMLDESDFRVPQRNDYNKNEQKRGGDAHDNLLKRHKCGLCEYSTQQKGNLNRHLKKHTGEKPHGCNLCQKRFTIKRILLDHMKVHVEEFLFHFPICLQGFDVEDEKIKHGTSCKVRRYECHLCKESFGSLKGNMIFHMRVHSGNKPFECKECFKCFTAKTTLEKHLKLHADSRSFCCSKCRTRFSHQEERNAHEKNCNRPVFKCDVCGKSFGSSKFNLVSHMRIHSGERPFECQHCLKRFQWKHILNRHMKSHTKKLPFKCSICRQGFAKQTQCKAHEKNCNRRSYECHLCAKFFGSFKSNLKIHMRTHSGDKPFQCQLCQNKFTRKANLKTHIVLIHNETR